MDRLAKPDLFVIDQGYPQALALGSKTVCVTRGLLSVLTPEEIAGVLAHEVGHLKHGDSRRRMIAAVVNTAGNAAAIVITGILMVVGLLLQTGADDRLAPRLGLFGLMIMAFALFLKAVLWLIQWLINLGFLAVGRREEFAADEFAKRAGFARELAGALAKMEAPSIGPTGLLAVITRSHPPVAVRIDRLLHGPG